MGQEHSAVARTAATAPNKPRAPAAENGSIEQGVRVVAASGSRQGDDPVDAALVRSAAIPLPHPVLPPPPVKDDVASALQGAAMMHELRSLVSGWLPPARDASAAASAPTGSAASASPPRAAAAAQPSAASSTPPAAGALAVGGSAAPDPQPGHADPGAETAGQKHPAQSEAPQAPSPHASPAAVRAEQDAWKAVTIDAAALEAVLCEVTGGARMGGLVERQQALMARVRALAALADQLKASVDAHVEQSRSSARMSDRVDRLKVSFADVQDVVEQCVATANILGASHFADDDEMCSFKNFLKHNPPRST